MTTRLIAAFLVVCTLAEATGLGIELVSGPEGGGTIPTLTFGFVLDVNGDPVAGEPIRFSAICGQPLYSTLSASDGYFEYDPGCTNDMRVSAPSRSYGALLVEPGSEVLVVVPVP